MIDTYIDRLALMVRESTEKRLREICATHPELLEQREDVVLRKQETPGNPMETRYLITLSGEEIAKFSVCIESSGLSFKICVSDVGYCSRK